MKEVLFILAVFCVYLIISFIAKSILKKAQGIYFILFSILYLLIVYLVFEGFHQLELYFRSRHIFLELGHADIALILALAGCLLSSIILIIIISLRRRSTNEK